MIPSIDADTARALQRCLHRIAVLDGSGALDADRLLLTAQLVDFTSSVARALPQRTSPPASRLVVTVADDEAIAPLRNRLGLRSLLQLVEDVIRTARDEVLVGSPFWTEQALGSLAPCIDGFQRRGGRFLLLTQGGSHAPASLPAVRKFVHARRDRGGGAALLLFDGEAAGGSDLVLHAKFVIADDRLGYLGSANMTHYGLEANFELGVRIGTPEVRDLGAVLSALEEARYITRVG
jgi:phosphatidylserine/phosphatidylglycerophosphate/cardiolipin synthase-like enzyme